MVRTGAAVMPSRRRVQITLGAVGVIVAGLLAGCGSDSDSGGAGASAASGEKKSDNPGLQFSGTYKVETVTNTVNGQPPNPAGGPSTGSFTWVVQSTCDGPGDSCVAVAVSTAPDPKRPLNMDRMEFVYENDTWSRIVVPNRRECIAFATNKPVDEPWVAMHTTTLTTDNTRGTDPITTVTGTYESLQGGTCSAKALGDITLTRTGDVPATTKPLGTMVVASMVANPPGAAWSGTYDGSSKPVSADPPSFITSAKADTERYTMTPTCTRAGDQCVVIASNAAAGNNPAVYAYADGGYERSTLSPKLNCTNGETGYSRRTTRFEIPKDAGSPIESMSSKQTLEVLGGCPGTVMIEGTAVRTGD